MKARELRELTNEELVQRAQEWKRKLLTLRFQRATGQLTNTAELVKTKRNIARVLTILRERGVRYG